MNSNFLITGVAGFIGSSIAKKLVSNGVNIVGIDNLNDYYDISLKNARIREIEKTAEENKTRFVFKEICIENFNALKDIFMSEKPSVIIHLAAQAGVRYSIENPSVYVQSNLVGFNNILEISKQSNIEHIIYASSSSVYGGNKNLPYKENQSVDHPVSIYAATKRSNELMAHTYSHLFKIPLTGLRLFTVYGPWGRPDMAPFLFTKAIIEGQTIRVNNFGSMKRDFTYIDDITEAIYKCCQKPASVNLQFNSFDPDPSSSLAPHRIFNIGNNKPIDLLYFIEIIEKNLNIKAKKELVPLPPGDVIATYADISSIHSWVGFKPKTSIEEGMKNFIDWFKLYFKY